MLDRAAEKTLIKAMMNGYMDEVTDEVPVNMFQIKESQELIKLIYSIKGAVTFNTVVREKRFDTDYLYECQGMQFSKDDLPYFIEKIKTAYVKKLGNDYIRELNKLIVSPCSLKEISEALRNGVNIDLEEKDSKLTILPEDYAGAHYENLVKRATNPEEKQGIHFKNFPELNHTFYGLKGGDLIMICAQSGHGKTAFALNIANDFSVDQDFIGYYANAEMDEEELTNRIASTRAVVPTQEVMSGEYTTVKTSDALTKLSEPYDLMRKKNLILSRIPIMSISTIRRGYKKLLNAGRKPDYILIDYIGRMELERREHGLTEWQKLYYLSEDIKTLAVELNIPIIALAQLNEDGQIEGAKKMKNACDGVLFFEPATDDDEKHMNPTQKKFANYKIVKYKVRRNDNSRPIYINFTKKYQNVTEVL